VRSNQWVRNVSLPVFGVGFCPVKDGEVVKEKGASVDGN
jgi:hypothetical protein